MVKCITSITVDEYNSRYSDWDEVSYLSSAEDIATFIDTFDAANIKGYMIAGVITKNGKYIFVVSNQSTGYDFIAQLNKMSNQGMILSAQNAKLLFGKEKSRGYYKVETKVEAPLPMPDFEEPRIFAEKRDIYPKEPRVEVSDTQYHMQSSHSTIPTVEGIDDDSKTEMFEEEDASATGFMDDDEYAEHGIEVNGFYLVQKDNGMRLKIDSSRGITIGRSASKVDYVLNSKNVSRKHARIYLSDGECKVADCESANGTFVDGLRVRAGDDVILPIDGTLLIGDIEFKLEK